MTYHPTYYRQLVAWVPGGTDAGEILRKYHDEVRWVYPVLNRSIQILEDMPLGSWANAEFRGFNLAREAMFTVRDDFVLDKGTGCHEVGHEYDKLLQGSFPSPTYARNRYMEFRQFGLTWDEMEAEASQQTPGSMAAWMYSPGESWAEAFRAAMTLEVKEKTMNWGKDINPVAAREFFRSLMKEAGWRPNLDLVSVGPTPNRWPNSFIRLDAIVMHTTQGAGLGSLSWMLNPSSRVSALYCIMEDGSVKVLGNYMDAFWHAGVVNQPRITFPGNPNLYTQGFEYAGYAAQPLTAQQFAMTRELVEHTRRVYDAPNAPAIPHSWIDSINRSDPGVDNYLRLLATLEDEMGITGDVAKEIIREMLRSEEGAMLVNDAIIYQSGTYKGYGYRLQRWINDNLVYKMPLMARLLGRQTDVSTPPLYQPSPLAPRAGEAMDLRGPRDTWPPEYR